MIQKVRRQLRMMRYYSATRPNTAWTRALEWALALSLLLAIPAQLVSEHLVTRRSTSETIYGGVLSHLDGRRDVVFRAGPEIEWRAGENPIAEFSIGFAERGEGWPIMTRSTYEPATIALNVLNEIGVRPNAGYDESDPMHGLILEALRGREHEALRESWVDQTPAPSRRRIFVTAVGVSVWWVTLVALAALGDRRRSAVLHDLARPHAQARGDAHPEKPVRELRIQPGGAGVRRTLPRMRGDGRVLTGEHRGIVMGWMRSREPEKPWEIAEQREAVRSLLRCVGLTVLLTPLVFFCMDEAFVTISGPVAVVSCAVYEYENGYVDVREYMVHDPHGARLLAVFSCILTGEQRGGIYSTSWRYESPEFGMQVVDGAAGGSAASVTYGIPPVNSEFYAPVEAYLEQQHDPRLLEVWRGELPGREYEWGSMVIIWFHCTGAMLMLKYAPDVIRNRRRRRRLATAAAGNAATTFVDPMAR